MGLYLALYQLEQTVNEELPIEKRKEEMRAREKLMQNVINYLSPSSPLEVIAELHAQKKRFTSVVDTYIQQEEERKYTWKDCFRKPTEMKRMNDLSFVLDMPLLRKSEYITQFHAGFGINAGILVIVSYFASPPAIVLGIAGAWAIAHIGYSYYKLLSSLSPLMPRKEEALRRAQYIDEKIKQYLSEHKS